MAHHVRIKATPHINKDGSTSKRAKDYTVTVRARGKKARVLGTTTIKKDAEAVKDAYWEALNNHRKFVGIK